jgi:hypothetical protein
VPPVLLYDDSYDLSLAPLSLHRHDTRVCLRVLRHGALLFKRAWSKHTQFISELLLQETLSCISSRRSDGEEADHAPPPDVSISMGCASNVIHKESLGEFAFCRPRKQATLSFRLRATLSERCRAARSGQTVVINTRSTLDDGCNVVACMCRHGVGDRIVPDKPAR